jgi:peptide/nickel transport system permease protein
MSPGPATGASMLPVPGAPGPPARSPAGLALARLKRDRFSVAGAALVLLMVAAAAAAPLLAPHDPTAIDPTLRLAPLGSPGYPLGGDELGRCVLSRLLWGARLSLLVAFVPVLVSLFIGVTAGALAAWTGGLLDEGVMRALDILLAFPPILLALGIAASLGPGTWNLIASLLVIGVPVFARLTRAAVLGVRARLFIEAAEALGARRIVILLRHVLPNVMAPILVYVTLQCGRTVIAATGLSFLGLGAPPPAPDWGGMLAAGQKVLAIAPHAATVPGCAIFLLTVALNLLGDGLRDALDPTLKD